MRYRLWDQLWPTESEQCGIPGLIFLLLLASSEIRLNRNNMHKQTSHGLCAMNQMAS